MSGLNPLSPAAGDELDRPFVLIVGGNYVGTTLASYLADDYEVAFVSRSPEAVERATRDDVAAYHVDSIDAQAFREADADRASVAIAASEEDSINLLAAQLLRTKFDVEHLVARVNHPDRVDSFRDLGVEAVCLSTAVISEVSEQLESVVDELPKR